MTLYEITENITEEPEEAVTIKEASKRLNRTVGSLYGAAAEGRLINGRYYLRASRPDTQQKQRPEPAPGIRSGPAEAAEEVQRIIKYRNGYHKGLVEAYGINGRTTAMHNGIRGNDSGLQDWG